jgi:LacI family transcriptional regulator
MTKQGKHPTLREVAKCAEVGTTTVSRVINGVEYVEPWTKARVERAIKELGYLPNIAARVLKGHKTRTIGLVVPSIADPFFSSCAEVLQGIARQHGFLLIVLTTQNEREMEREAINTLTQHRVDGFVIAPADAESDELRSLLMRVTVPVVALDRPVAGAVVPSVVADNFVGAKHATRHLIAHGYKRIACLTGEIGLYTIRERARGYQAAMAAAGLKAVLSTAICDYASCDAAIAKMLKGPDQVQAIFTLKNSVTVDAFEALQRRSVPIPGKVALLGYDDFQLAGTVRPAITVVQQPIEELGKTAAELLFRHLKGASAAAMPAKARTRQQVLLKTSLIPRASCGCRPDPSSRGSSS